MQIQSTKGQSSCTDVDATVESDDECVDIGLACSHGTVLYIVMSFDEAFELATKLIRALPEGIH